MRALLYARYSTDKQRESSIDDQLRAAHARAAAEGWTVAETLADEGVSGSVPLAMRAGGKTLLAHALASRFDVLIVEGLDRLSRELGEAETIVKRLEHRGVRIIGTADGYDTHAAGRKVMRIARGLVNELYLDDLREKTHRGLAGQFDRGLSAGGRSYGYRSEPVAGGHRLMVDEHQAQVVRRIFREFAAGDSTRTIVHRLNAEGIRSGRGGTWAVSALHGSTARGLGLLVNELYIGRVVWNRRQWLKDPETGRRRYVERPRSEWQIREQPELRIVDADTWQAVQQRLLAKSGGLGSRSRRGKPTTTLFGGLLRCGVCGGAWIAVNAQRYGCGVRKDRGPAVCSNSLTLMREVVDKRLLAELRDDLLAPAALAEVHAHVRQILASMATPGQAQEDARTRLREIEREVGNLVAALATMGHSQAVAARLVELEREKATLQARETVREAPAVSADTIMAGYRRKAMELRQALEAPAELHRARQALEQGFGEVVVTRDADGAVYAELDEPPERLLIAAGDSVSNWGCGGGIRNKRRIRLA